MGIGMSELLLIAFVAVMFFGPAALAAWIAYTIGRSQAPNGESMAGTAEPSDTALDTARERYARGEINREEFEDIKRTLGY